MNAGDVAYCAWQVLPTFHVVLLLMCNDMFAPPQNISCDRGYLEDIRNDDIVQHKKEFAKDALLLASSKSATSNATSDASSAGDGGAALHGGSGPGGGDGGGADGGGADGGGADDGGDGDGGIQPPPAKAHRTQSEPHPCLVTFLGNVCSGFADTYASGFVAYGADKKETVGDLDSSDIDELIGSLSAKTFHAKQLRSALEAVVMSNKSGCMRSDAGVALGTSHRSSRVVPVC